MRFSDGPRRRRMIRGTIARIGDLAMRYGDLSQLAILDCTSSRRSTVMGALPRAIAARVWARPRRIAEWRSKNSLAYPRRKDQLMPQLAVERLFELTRHADLDDYLVEPRAGQPAPT